MIDLGAERSVGFDGRPANTEELLNLLLLSVGEGVWITEATGRTARANQRMADLLGVSHQNLLAGSLARFASAELANWLPDHLRSSDPKTEVRLPLYGAKSGGSHTCLDARARPQIAEDGRFVSILIIANLRVGPMPGSSTGFFGAAVLAGLSSRQRQIAGMLQLGYRVPRISEELGITQSTTRSHVSALCRELGVDSQQELLLKIRG